MVGEPCGVVCLVLAALGPREVLRKKPVCPMGWGDWGAVEAVEEEGIMSTWFRSDEPFVGWMECARCFGRTGLDIGWVGGRRGPLCGDWFMARAERASLLDTTLTDSPVFSFVW